MAFLLAVIAYAAFAQGATSVGDQAWVQTTFAVALTAAAAAWLWHGSLPVSAPRLAWLGVGLLVAFAVWAGITLAWSVTPDRTLLETNRAITYVMSAGLGLTAACWWRHAAERLAIGYLAIAGLIALYALGGKIAPGIHLDGLFDLDNTTFLPRLRAPLDYWNALGLVLLMATPIALAVVVDRERTTRARLTALALLELLIVTLALTYSRGGVIAVLVGMLVFGALSRRAPLMIVVVALAAVAAVFPLVDVFTTHSMTGLNQPLGDRERDGLILGAIFAASLIGLTLAGRAVLGVEDRLQLSPRVARTVAVAVAGAAVLALFAGGAALAASKHGLPGSISRQWASFRKVRRDPLLDPQHLITTNAGNRWTWWSEAAGAWSDRPLEGWGSGSFPVVHLQYRTNMLEVQQPHSVPMQLLSETGLVGAILALGGMAALAIVGLRGARQAAGTPMGLHSGERLMRAALAAAICAWLFHGLYDWDLDIPGATIPALAFMGVLAGRSRSFTPPSPAIGTGARVSTLALITLGASVVALGSIFPALADSKVTEALALAGGGHPSTADRRQATRAAELASRLDPLGTKPLLTLAAIQQGGGDLRGSKTTLRRAARRQPDDSIVWFELTRLALVQHDDRAVRTGVRHVLALNPRDPRVRAGVVGQQNPAPRRSATAVRTPLTSTPVAANGP